MHFDWPENLDVLTTQSTVTMNNSDDLFIYFYIWFQKTATDGKRQEIIVLDSKRSNAINIGLTVLPPPRTIKTAILNFDEYALSKEGIEVILPWFKITFRFANYAKSTSSNEANLTWWNY